MTQFYRTTIENAIADYEDGALTAYGLVKYYIRVKFKEGWKVSINPIKVAKQLGLKLSTFYRALKKIKEVFCDRHIVLISEKEITNSENNFLRSEKISCKSENENPQTPNKTKIHSDPPDIRSNIDHISLSDEATGDWQLAIGDGGRSIASSLSNRRVGSKPKPKAKSQKLNALSEEEREKFLSFGMDKVNELPKRPTLPSKWIAANFDDLYSEFKLHSAPETQEATKERRFHEWCDLMKDTGRLHRKYQPRGTNEWVLIDNCGSRISYEDASKTYTLESLRKLVGGKK